MKKTLIFISIFICAVISMTIGDSTYLKQPRQPVKNPITVDLIYQQVALKSEPIKLNTPLLTCKGVLLLNCDHPAFGGFSDLVISQDRKSFLAVTDMAFWLKGELLYSEAGFLNGVTRTAKLGQLLDTQGKIFPNKYRSDSEGLCKAPDGGYLVSYERVHRVNHYKPEQKMSLSGTPVRFNVPPKIENLPGNGGIETILTLPDKRVLMIAEGYEEFGPFSYAAVGENNNWMEFSYLRSSSYRPTSAVCLPNGEVILLERSYTGPGTLSIRISKINSKNFSPGAQVIPEELMQIKSPLPVDNFEGIDAVTTADGKTFLYIISDNNFSPLQQTFLIMFEIKLNN